ncbi:hypothetical protein BASA83_012174 [Batrachochytrium salamandrivorans]|nr:hypothetical protein BASA83_012174 [Batrachochytrium salamandrivorans]
MTDSWIPHIIDEPPNNPSKTFILKDNVICSLISSTIDQNQMHLVSDAHGYPMFAKACWESIKAAYTSVSITDGMDLYRDQQNSTDPSLGVAKLLDQMDLLHGANSLLPLSHLPIQFGSVWLPPSYWMAVMHGYHAVALSRIFNPTNYIHPNSETSYSKKSAF